MSDSSRPHGLQSTKLLSPWGSPGKSTGVGCHCLLLIYMSIPYNYHNSFHGIATIMPILQPRKLRLNIAWGHILRNVQSSDTHPGLSDF